MVKKIMKATLYVPGIIKLGGHTEKCRAWFWQAPCYLGHPLLGLLTDPNLEMVPILYQVDSHSLLSLKICFRNWPPYNLIGWMQDKDADLILIGTNLLNYTAYPTAATNGSRV